MGLRDGKFCEVCFTECIVMCEEFGMKYHDVFGIYLFGIRVGEDEIVIESIHSFLIRLRLKLYF